jgi:hypothetical protein
MTAENRRKKLPSRRGRRLNAGDASSIVRPPASAAVIPRHHRTPEVTAGVVAAMARMSAGSIELIDHATRRMPAMQQRSMPDSHSRWCLRITDDNDNDNGGDGVVVITMGRLALSERPGPLQPGGDEDERSIDSSPASGTDGRHR